MKKSSTIEFDGRKGDYLIDGEPLLEHLEKHEKIGKSGYQVAIGCQTEVVKRLRGSAPPDLQGKWIAIYLCGHCGGYDGSSIGMRLRKENGCILWSEIGQYEDYDEGYAQPFKKVKEYIFDADSYNAFLAHAGHYEYKG